jgi:hypothetical protein
MLTADDSQPVVVHEISVVPDWIAGNDLRPIDRRAGHGRDGLRDHLSVDRPLSLALLEETEFDRQHRVEVRALACRSLVLLGVLEPTITAMEDERQRAYWLDHFLALQSALTADPDAAARIEGLLTRTYGETGKTVYRLLWGYSSDQLAAGDARSLVDYLEHAETCVRVLAYLNLQQITGMTHWFRPWQPPGQERDKLLRWRQDLEEGRITYPTVPVTPPSSGSPGTTGRS